uniref:Neuropeptide Y receptor-like n=1 Tax=Saccoglossus kowalevskii TaxID=10224 RepID=A0ABM0LZ83_SACKO|nr:PREDICTED: neuropeptide Y receptor-like [Saccoglossus kowalevskii]
METSLRIALQQYNFSNYSFLDNVTYEITGNENQQQPVMDLYLPIWLQVILAILYACTSALAVIGNLVVCYIVLGNRRMRTVTNYFIVNLAISDFLMAVICVNLTFYYSINFHWPFGYVMCALVQYIQMVSVSISIFTLVAISLDRYVAIIHPLRPRMTKKQAFIVIIIIWVLAGGISLPAAINSEIDTSYNSTDIICKETWQTEKQRSIYTITLMILQYFLPLVILSITYSIIGYAIWGRKPPGERERHRDARQAESKKKIIVWRTGNSSVYVSLGLVCIRAFKRMPQAQESLVSVVKIKRIIVNPLHTCLVILVLLVSTCQDVRVDSSDICVMLFTHPHIHPASGLS